MTYRNFTILGNPAITDNGDISNVSSSDQISAALTHSGSELTLTGEYTWGGVAPSGASGLFFLGDSSNFVQLYQVQSGQLELFTRVSGTSYYDFGRFTITANVPLKYTLTLGVDSLNLTGYQNGVEVVNNTISTHIPAVSTLTNIKLSSFEIVTQGTINIRQMLITDNNGYVYQPYSSDFKPINRIYNRHDTASNFSINNPVLGNGEIAIETDTSKIKVGDGNTAYNTLPYAGGSGSSYTAGDGITVSNQNVISVNYGTGLSVDNKATLPNNFTGSSADITSSSQGAGQSNYQAFDGNESTFWGLTQAPSSGTPAWIMRHHDAIQVTSVDILFTSEIIQNIKVFGSNDGTTFTEIGFYDNNTSSRVTVPCSVSQTYTYTKIQYTQAYSGWGQTLEININYLSTAPVLANSLALDGITRLLPITQTDYDNLQTKDANTFYIIVSASS